MKFYKIIDFNTGLFSKGGAYCLEPKKGRPKGWSKTGKVWTTLGYVMSHLNQYYKAKYNFDRKTISFECSIPNSWHIVEYYDGEEVYHNAKQFFLEERKLNI